MKSMPQSLRIVLLMLSLGGASLAHADANLHAISQHGGAMVETASGARASALKCLATAASS